MSRFGTAWVAIGLSGVLASCAADDPAPGAGDGGDGGSSSGGGSGAGAGAGSEDACHGVGFEAEAIVWSLPDYGLDANGGALFEEVGGNHDCPDGGVLRYQVIDLDGDTLPDLVVTDHCNADTQTGASQWRLHLNVGSGFAPDPVLWALPDYGVDAGGAPVLVELGGNASCADGGTLRYQIMDLDGDKLPDLVVSDNCSADTQTGSSQWRVHANTGSGFAPEPMLWGLPDYGVDAGGGALFEEAGTYSCPGGGELRHMVLELDGDGRPDLVVSDNCSADTLTGKSRWRVHANTGSGFAPEPTQWTLPDYGVDANGGPLFEAVGGDQSCPDGGTLRYEVLELDGDGLPDLVVSDNCSADAATGTNQWRVHANTGDGFAPEPTLWTLPSYGADANGGGVFERVAGSADCPDGGRLRFQVLHVSDDAKPELVVSDNCNGDASTGSTAWRVHDNSGIGFAAEPRPWSLPSYGTDSGGASALELVVGDGHCPDDGRLRHQVLRLAAGAPTTLVVSDNCAADGATGRTQWRIHPTVCN